MSKGNAEQPTAQAPRGHSSPNRVEVSGDGEQGAPQSPGTPRPAPGTLRRARLLLVREINLAATARRTGRQQALPTIRPPRRPRLKSPRARTARAKSPPESNERPPPPTPPRTGAAGESRSPQPPGTAARPQPTAGGRPGGSPNPPSTQQKHEPGPPIQQKHEPGLPTQQRQGPPQGPSQTTQPKQVPSAGSATTATAGRAQAAEQLSSPGAAADRWPGGERFSPGAASDTPSPPNPETAHTPQAPGAVPVWDPPPPPAPKQSVLARLGFGRKTEPPEASPTTQPGQQQPAAPATQPAPTSPGGTTASSAPTGPVPPAGPQAGTPLQQRPAPGNPAGTPAGPGAAVAAGLAAAATTQAASPPQAAPPQGGAPQAPPGQPGTPQGPVRPGETTGRAPAVPGSASPVAPPAGPQAPMPGAVNPAARMPGAPAYLQLRLQSRCRHQARTLRTGRPGGISQYRQVWRARGRRRIRRPSPRWAWPGVPARRGCGCRGSTRGR